MKKTKAAVEKKRSRQEELALTRRKILTLTPEKALEAVLDSPLPVTLVQSFAEEDLHLLVHTIGPDDAQPVLALASNQQWEYLLDVETWSHDRMDMGTATQWLQRLLSADPDRFTHWIMDQELDTFEFYLLKNIDLALREHDQDPADLGDDFITEDQTHYVRLRTLETLSENQKQLQEARDQFVLDVLKRIAVFDYPRYVTLLLESTALLPAEAEEELFRQRTIRQAEKGFLPFDEAVGVYQALTVNDLHNRIQKSIETVGGRPTEAYPLPLEAVQSCENANLFAQTLARIGDQGALQRLQAEFAGLCNQVIAADQQVVREKETLTQVVAKVAGYISIGMEQALEESKEADPYGPANLIRNYLLIDIFRVGYGCALAVKWRAERWSQESWFSGAGLSLNFWGEAGLGVLGGLFLKKPLFFNNYTGGSLYREFATLADIRQTEKFLDNIIAFDTLLSLMGVEPAGRKTSGFLTYKNLLLTLWADHILDIRADRPFPTPITIVQFRRLFPDLWQDDTLPRRISNTTKELFLGWLSGRSGLAGYEITERMGQALEQLFKDIETELGAVDLKYLDPRFIQLFLFET